MFNLGNLHTLRSFRNLTPNKPMLINMVSIILRKGTGFYSWNRQLPKQIAKRQSLRLGLVANETNLQNLNHSLSIAKTVANHQSKKNNFECLWRSALIRLLCVKCNNPVQWQMKHVTTNFNNIKLPLTLLKNNTSIQRFLFLYRKKKCMSLCPVK